MNFKAILIAATLVVGSAAFAQAGAKAGGQAKGGQVKGGGPGGPGGPGGGRFQMRTPEERAERLAKGLSLNADQKKKAIAVYKSIETKTKTLFTDKKMSEEQKRAAFGKLREESTTKIKAFLTKDQIKKLDEMRQRRGPGGPGGGGPGRGPGGAAGGPPKGGVKAGGKGG